MKLLAWPGDGTRWQAVQGVRAHLENVDRIGGQYAVRHLGVYWGGGGDVDGEGREKPGGEQYGVVMEDGGVPLDQYLAEHALSYVERVRLAVGLSEAVGELHRLELVHRDLKPSNVVVDASMVVRLCDLEEVRDGIVTTMHSHTVRSPMYTCPVVGEAGGYGSSADVYSLSLMVGEILVGLPVLGLYAEAVGRVRRRAGVNEWSARSEGVLGDEWGSGGAACGCAGAAAGGGVHVSWSGCEGGTEEVVDPVRAGGGCCVLRR